MKPLELHSDKEIASRVRKLGKRIRNDAGDGEILLIGILKGAAIFLADLLRAIPGDVHYEFIDVLRDVSDTETADALEIDFLTHFSIENRNVVLLKDVVSTGVIETYLIAQLRAKNPADLKLVALIDRPDMRTVPLEVDYALFSGAEGVFVGYGLEHQDRQGNLRGLYAVSNRR